MLISRTQYLDITPMEMKNGYRGNAYKLKDLNNNTFTYWDRNILLDNGRFFELQIECDDNYSNRLLKVIFVTKVNMPFIDQHNGIDKNGSLNILRNWNSIAF